MVPTIRQVMKCYGMIAMAERMKTGRPGERTVRNVLLGTECVCKAAGIGFDEKVDSLTRKAIDLALVSFVERGLSRLTAWSYIGQLRGLFAKWCENYYRDAGWDISPLDMPVFRVKAPRYERPSAEMLARVKDWYESLEGEKWFASTMMLEFAMRNGDVMRLKRENFVEREVKIASEGETGDKQRVVRHFLNYTPHKTALSSGRSVSWPIHEIIWRKISNCGGPENFNVTEETFDAMNRDLRKLGFTGEKGAYELRKICIDHIYERFGAEMAVSISGDDIKTITRYYADPAQPNVGAVRVVDLL